MTDISKWFDDAIGGGGGSPQVTCQCGRTTYADSPYMAEGERYELDALHKERPKEYICLADSDTVSHVQLGDRTFVFGCPCDGLPHMERFFWTQRKLILRYFRARLDEELREKLADSADVDAVRARAEPPEDR